MMLGAHSSSNVSWKKHAHFELKDRTWEVMQFYNFTHFIAVTFQHHHWAFASSLHEFFHWLEPSHFHLQPFFITCSHHVLTLFISAFKISHKTITPSSSQENKNLIIMITITYDKLEQEFCEKNQQKWT